MGPVGETNLPSWVFRWFFTSLGPKAQQAHLSMGLKGNLKETMVLIPKSKAFPHICPYNSIYYRHGWGQHRPTSINNRQVPKPTTYSRWCGGVLTGMDQKSETHQTTHLDQTESIRILNPPVFGLQNFWNIPVVTIFQWWNRQLAPTSLTHRDHADASVAPLFALSRLGKILPAVWKQSSESTLALAILAQVASSQEFSKALWAPCGSHDKYVSKKIYILGITGEKVVENPLTKSPAKLSLKHHLTVPFFSNKPTWCFLASSIGSLADCENDGFEGPGSRSFVAQSIPLDILDLDAQLLGRHRKLFIAMCTVTCAHFLLHPSSWVMWYTRSIPQYNSCLFVTSPTGLLVLEGILKGSGPPCCIASLVRNVQGSALKGGRTKRWAFKGVDPVQVTSC